MQQPVMLQVVKFLEWTNAHYKVENKGKKPWQMWMRVKNHGAEGKRREMRSKWHVKYDAPPTSRRESRINP